MALLTKAVKGTQDLLPEESAALSFVERKMSEIAENYGFREIRTPVFEHTELFSRSVGDSTDVVQKEMYTFDDKGGRSLTLRPEGTAGAMRAFLEHGLFNEVSPQKLYYNCACYRYEKPQAGRLREFHQFGAECYGSESPAADAELISLASDIFHFFGLDGLELHINSIGCPKCRAGYRESLYSFFKDKEGELCGTCLDRLEKNPLRILDCKSPLCGELAKKAPKMLDFLCPECREHFESLKELLSAYGISYTVDPFIVRGLDYYSRTVFEFVSSDLGAKDTVCGGGRYDGLAEELGAGRIPALGFAVGLERLLLLLKAKGRPLTKGSSCALYIASAGKAALLKAAQTAAALRAKGLFVSFDTVGRSLKAQMKYADKIGAEYVAVIGDRELESGRLRLRDMRSGEERELSLCDFAEDFMKLREKL